jgi:hypothetical protein
MPNYGDQSNSEYQRENNVSVEDILGMRYDAEE